MTYQEALAYIASLEPRGWRLGLDRMRAFCKAAGLDETLSSLRYVHVAGTNGKGSTTAYLQSTLVEAGHRTGAFFSPYVVDPRERVQFGREMISRDDLARVTQDLIPVAESFTDTEFSGITEFEFKTAIGFEFWRRKECEWVALEVGLGGRFDATNVVTPAASIVVSVGMDHVNILGDSLSAIAGEKAGIIKPGVPAVVGQLPVEALEVVERVAGDCGSEVWRYGREVFWEPDGAVRMPGRRIEGIRTGMVGTMQGHNLALALAALEMAGAAVTDEQARLGAERAYAPGRFQVVRNRNTTFVLDGAHNSDAAEVLQASMTKAYAGRRVVLLTNMVRGHEPSEFYSPLASTSSEAHVVPIDFHRAYPVDETAGALAELGFQVTRHDDLSEGLDQAADAAGPDGIVLVTGSYYLVGEILRLIQPALP
jgi:dihydrofolate synthase/folylpolyglutamate synthase